MKKKKDTGLSTVGQIIDLPIEEFKVQIAKQRFNVGTIHNIYLNVVSAYNELNTMKDGLLQAVKEEHKKPEEVKEAIEGLYMEMMKAEEKCLYLKQLEDSLLKGANEKLTPKN